MIFSLTFGLLILMVLGVPISLALGISGLLGYIMNIGSVNAWLNAGIISQRMNYSLGNFLLISIPLFILAAKFMNSSGITKKIFGFANTSVGFLPGGLAHSNVFASLLFSGMSGSATSDAAGLGQIEVEAMVSHGYKPNFSAAVTASSSTIGPIFPPSVPLVIYSTISGLSVGRLFLGGIVPGILMTASLMIMIVIYALKHDVPRLEKPNFKTLASSFSQAFLPLMTPVILLGGIWSGVFTPTESATVAALYAFIISFFVYRDLSFKDIKTIFISTAKETASIGMVIAAAAFYGWVLARSGLTTQFANWLNSYTTNPTVYLFVLCGFFLVVGCFLEQIAAILIFCPVILPTSFSMGIDPIQLGLVIVLTMMIGLLTPPFGICLFIVKDYAKISFGEMVRSTIPFIIPLLLVLIMIILFPGLVLWLPSILY
ncbi:MAG: TRAP transporter large permease [Spirochaetales bacterium]|nr:TRAP transporter large permease [Spirochaetales bacterium]